MVMAWVIIEGSVFTLPPGPLCDEGMVLFMEGGCDWGESNVFFHSKLGLLIALNLVFVAAWRAGIREVAGFTPHVMVLLYVTLDNLSGAGCDSYYSHPNGSIGQMTLEAIAFAAIGMSMLTLRSRRTNGRLLAILLAWNGFSVAVFYAGLVFTNHWTWSHTWFICLVQAFVAIAAGSAGWSSVGQLQNVGRGFNPPPVRTDCHVNRAGSRGGGCSPSEADFCRAGF